MPLLQSRRYLGGRMRVALETDLTERGIVEGKMLWGAMALPKNSKIIGKVTRNEFNSGALIKLEETGLCVQGNAGCLTSIPYYI